MDDEDLHNALQAALAEAAAHPTGQPAAAAEHFSECLAKRATEALTSQEASRSALLLAHEAFLGPRDSDALLDTATLLVAEPLGRCADRAGTAQASQTYKSLLGRMAMSCSARDTIVALMAVLDEGQKCAARAWLHTCLHEPAICSPATPYKLFYEEAFSESQQAPGSCGAAQGRPWRSSDAAALHALPLALRRLQRQRARLLSDALAGALAHLPPAFAHAHALCAAGSRLPSGAPAAQDSSSSDAALNYAQLCNGSVAAGSHVEPDLVADASAFAAAVAALPHEWGAAGVDPGIKETIRVFILRLLAAATAGRALEPDLARSGLPALHARAAAELAALQRGRGGVPRLVAALAAGLLDALRPVPAAVAE